MESASDWYLYVMDKDRQCSETERRARKYGSWDAAYFVTIARTFGMGVNGDLMEQWTASIPMEIIGYHADDLFQLEALFLGQAGLLKLDPIPDQYQHDALNEGYFAKPRNEYLYLVHKYSLCPLDGRLWKSMGKGSNRNPHSVFSFLANMCYQHKTSLQSMLACESIKEVTRLLEVSATPYWQMRSHFGAECKTCAKRLSAERLNLIVINAVVPMLFAYGRSKAKEVYCDKRQCLRCRFGLLHHQFLHQWHIPRLHLFCRRSMGTGKMKRAVVVLKKQRLKPCQRVLLSEDSPYLIFIIGVAAVKLVSLHLGKFGYQRLINDKLLLAILPLRLVFVPSNPRTQELRHAEMRIAQQGRNPHDRSHHLRIERAATITHQHIRPFAVNYVTNQSQCLLRMGRQVWRNDLSPSLECLP